MTKTHLSPSSEQWSELADLPELAEQYDRWNTQKKEAERALVELKDALTVRMLSVGQKSVRAQSFTVTMVSQHRRTLQTDTLKVLLLQCGMPMEKILSLITQATTETESLYPVVTRL